MHPDHWLPLAQQRIDDLHQQARRERLARSARRDREGRYSAFVRRVGEALGHGLTATGDRRWNGDGGLTLEPR